MPESRGCVAESLFSGRRQSGYEHWQSSGGRRGGSYSYAYAAALGGGLEFHDGGGGDEGAAGDARSDLGEVEGGIGRLKPSNFTATIHIPRLRFVYRDTPCRWRRWER